MMQTSYRKLTGFWCLPKVLCKCNIFERIFLKGRDLPSAQTHTHLPEVPGGMNCFTKADFTGVEEGELKPLL